MRKQRWGFIAASTVLAVFLCGCSETSDYLPVIYDTYNTSNYDSQDVSYYEQTIIGINSETFDAEDFGDFKNNMVQIQTDDMDYEGVMVAPGDDGRALFSINGSDAEMGEFGAAFYNNTAAEGISTICITYEATDDFVIKYGNNRNNLEYVATIPASGSYTEYELPLVQDASYFRICAENEYVYVEEIELLCNGFEIDDTDFVYTDGIRYIPETDYEPSEGETLSLPICELNDDGTVTVVEWRDYTYHSYEYCYDRVVNYGDDPEDYALTDPVDVAGYFVLFNRIPVNYGVKQNRNGGPYTDMVIQSVPEIDEVQDLFGKELSRCVSEYNYTDGYVSAVDYNAYENTNRPLYYEFDIDADGTYSSRNRGVARVIGWVGGFEPYSDDINTATVTYNHYYTMGEYSNCGFFNEEFDALSSGLSGRIFAGCTTTDIE